MKHKYEVENVIQRRKFIQIIHKSIRVSFIPYITYIGMRIYSWVRPSLTPPSWNFEVGGTSAFQAWLPAKLKHKLGGFTLA